MIEGILLFSAILTLSFLASSFLLASKNLSTLTRKIFYVPCKKSASGALLLGGLPIFVGSAVAVFATSTSTFNTLTWFIPAALLTLIGYLDDKLELRASIKLGLQVLAAVTFSGMLAYSLDSSLTLFILYLVWTLGVFNGSNLLDGIDTYTVKYSTVTFAALTLLAYTLGFESLALTAALFIAPILAFYYFNQYPSKLHLGEIGGTVVGLNGLFIAGMIYKTYMATAAVSAIGIDYNMFFLSVISLHLPMTELGISLLRRSLKGKSPFFGDKLHIHYILAKKEMLGASRTANLLSGLHLVSLTLGAICANLYGAGASFLITGICYVSYYLYFGAKYWAPALFATTLDAEDMQPSAIIYDLKPRITAQEALVEANSLEEEIYIEEHRAS